MALSVPLTKFTTTSPVVASYSFTDLADGSGNVNFYLMNSRDSTGSVLKLVPQTIIGGKTGDATAYLISTSYVTFESTPFNIPRTANGTAYFSGQYQSLTNAGNFLASLIHYDGSTETTIGAEVTLPFLPTDDGFGFNFSFDIDNKLFAQGDTLRLKFKCSSVGTRISTDPSGVFPAGTTPSKIIIPFKIE